MGCSSLTAVETFHFPASHQKSQYSVQTINAVLDTDSRQTLHLQQNIFAKDSCGRQTVHQKRIPNHLASMNCKQCFRTLQTYFILISGIRHLSRRNGRKLHRRGRNLLCLLYETYFRAVERRKPRLAERAA